MPEDIRVFFSPAAANSQLARRSVKRPWEQPIGKPYQGFFPLEKPLDLDIPIVNPGSNKRIKVAAVKAHQKIKAKLEIMQWHFSQESPNCVITAKRFFPDEPNKVRTVQNWAKKGLAF